MKIIFPALIFFLRKKDLFPRETWVGFLSSFSEAYNMSLIPFLAPILGPMLLSSGAVSEKIFFSYLMIFVGSFIMYPIGAWYYGVLGDKKGRRVSCISSSFGLAVTTGSMALLPTFWFPDNSWILFIILMALQFFFSAGEYHSSIIYSLEHGSSKQQGMMSGFSCFFSVLGLALASSNLYWISHFSYYFSWRVPFVLGFFTGFCSFFLKNFCTESPFFEEREKGDHSLTFSFIRDNFKTLLNITLVSGIFYILYSYIFLFLPLVYDVSTSAESDTVLCLLIYGFALLVAGYISSRYGIVKIMAVGVVLAILGLLGMMLADGFFSDIKFYWRAYLTISASLFIGPIHGWTLDQVSPDKRCRLIGLSTSVASAVFFNSTVPLCLYIYKVTASSLPAASYVILMLMIGFFIVAVKKNRLLK